MNEVKKIIKFNKKYNFIMFEIILAMVVVMFGIFGVYSLMPVGMNTQKQALGTSYITDAAEQLLRLNASAVKKDWNWLNVFADSKPGQNDQGREWNSTSLFEESNLQLKADVSFDSASNGNSGLFLLKQLTRGEVEYSGIVRMWKDITVNDNSSIDVTIYAEVSWPAEKPYYSREKEAFSLQLSKAPEIALADAAYDDDNCSVTKANGGGYSTTISNVTSNADSTYTIELTVEHGGCSGSGCPELDHFSVEAQVGSYSNVSFTGVSGLLNSGPTLSNDPFDGFKVDYTTGIGNGVSGTFTIVYTLTVLQDQRVVAHGAANGSAYTASFSIADFEYVLTCSESPLPSISSFPCLTMWAFYDNGATLYRYTLSENDGIQEEGAILGVSGTINLEALTIDPDGVIYIVNNDDDDEDNGSFLYKIMPDEIDGDPATPVNAISLGNANIADNRIISSLQFINGTLYALGTSNEMIYSINTTTGQATLIREFTPDSFVTDGLTLAADGTVYFNKTVSDDVNPSELWKFTSFPNGSIVKVMDIAGSFKVEALAAHPNGNIYAADDFNWFRIDPIAQTTEIEIPFAQDTEGMDFFFNSPHESASCGSSN